METNLELPEGFEVEYSPNQIPEGFELEETPQLNNEMLYGRIGKPTYISAYKAPNVIDGLKNAWDFVTQVPYAAFMEQKKDNEAAELRTKGMMLRRIGQDLSEEEKARIQELDNPYSLGKYNQANNYGIYSKFVLDSNGEYFDKGSPAVIPERMGNGIKTLYAEVSKQTAIMYAIAKDAGIAATLGGLAGMGIGAITGAISTKTPQGAMAGAKTGFEGGAKLLARTAVAKKSFELEAGFMRQELEELNNEFIANGTEPLTDREMDDLASAVGIINASLEYVGLGAVLKSIPNGQKVIDMFGKQGVKELAKDATFREQFKVIAADLTKAGISEGSTEMLQETTNFVYGNIARKIRNVAPRPLADKMDEIVQAGLVGAISAITMGGIGTAAQVTTVKIKQGIKPEVAKQEAEAMTIDERNEFINENIDTLAEAANEEADNILKGGVTYNRYKNELIKQGADEQQADNSAQLIEQAYRVIADKFGNEGIEHLKNANLQVIINNNNAKQIQAEEEILDTIMSEEEKSDKLMQFSVDELKTDAKTFQYKGNSNTEGVLAENGLEGVEKWDNKVSGKVFVYENKNGERFIADGHQRLGLAKRLKDPNIKLDGYLFREADGFTPAQVRTLAAYKNIGEKSGTALDAAKIIKEVGLEKLPKTIPMNSTLFKDGVSLSRLGDVAFEKVVNEEIPMNYAARVADAIRNNEEKQAAAIDLIRKYYIEGRVPNAERAFNIACDINSAPTNVVEQINLFGTQELTELLYVEKSEIVDRAVKDLQTNKKLFLKASKNKGKLESKGKTKIDKAASEMTAREAAIAADIIQHRAYVAGDISDKANELAQKVKDGELKVAEAVKEFEDFVLTPKILKEITGYTRKTIKLNQAAIDKAENISDLLTEDEAGTITPLEFYQKGFYQGAAKDVTETTAFKNWFGDSKVVDEDGKPLVVYHGTNAEFNIFKYDKNNQTGFDFGEAYYFTSNSDKASGYAYNPEKDSRIIELEKQRKGIVAKILSIAETKTFKIKDKNKYNELKKEHKQLTDEINFIRENGKAEDTNGIVMPIYLKLENPLIVNAQGKYYFEVYENYFEEARKNNNDGIIVKNVIDNPRGEFIPMDVYIAFSPEQIKSVNNQGTFDTNNSNIYYQSVETAGATEYNAEDAKVEWLNKGTESKYFKRWFDGSKVVDKKGNPLVVYHGTTQNFDEFYSGAFFTDDYMNADGYAYGENIYECYLKISNPLVINCKGAKWDNLDTQYGSSTQEIISNLGEEYDGVIFNNINDNWIDDEEYGDVGTVYYVVDNKQIKSVNNQGTFDANNPNIYYQSEDNYIPIEKVEITNVNDDNVEINNSIWIPKLTLRKEGIPYELQKKGYEFLLDRNRRNYAGIDFTGLQVRSNSTPLESEKEQKPVDLKIEKIAKKYFGTTKNINEAGYILNDGSLLDLSGKNMGGSAGRRSIDHREIVDAFMETDYEDEVAFDEFIDNGAIRFMPESNSFFITRMPSDKQFAAMKKIIEDKNGEVTFELSPSVSEWGYDNNFSKDYEAFSNPEKILDDVRVYFKGGQISPHKRYYQSAYHGSPYDFEKFSTKNIGTGEGAQAHGWGLYFASDKSLSESYRKRLSNSKRNISYYGEEIIDSINGYKYKEMGDAVFADEANQMALQTAINQLSNYDANKEDVIKNAEKNLEFAKEKMPEWVEHYEKVLYILKNHDIQISKGQLYKVDIPETDEMLDEDKEYEQQNSHVKKALKRTFADAKKYLVKDEINLIQGSYMYDIADNKEGDAWRSPEKIEENKVMLNKINKTFSKYMNGTSTSAETKFVKSLDCYKENSYMIEKIKDFGFNMFGNGTTGETFYAALSRALGSEQASKMLNKHGIKGITYNGVSDGRCYVVFDDKAIKVLNRYYQEEAQGNLFYDNLKARDLRKVKGYYLPAENLIELFKNADESTIIHEFAHWWLDRLVKYSENNEELSEDIAAVRKWVKNDGGEFTREQHEKFARGFETYIRSGYAKNNRLKKLFEDFKNALLSIYDSILQLGFKKEDMPQIQDLFDRLLTTEHERIKATVFDKIAEIDEKIDNIRENEKEEFKELDEIWKDNIAILNRRSDKKRKVEEYIQLAETIPFRETKETREWKQRYKNATLDILATYSGKSRSWVANSRNWEKLQDLIGQANDGISASNGFLQEWAEFYTDTGVSYENSEVGADEELAQQAFDVMVAGDYNHPLDENYEFRDIDAFVSKIDYLAAKIKTVKGEEKNVVFEALTTLFSKMPDMPDDVMAEISKKLIKAGEELEEDTKEDFNRKVYPSIPIVQQLQFYITKKLNDLKVYNPETRYKMRLNKSHRLYKYIQNVNSVNQAKKQIKKINEFIIDDMRNNQRSLLHKEIQKQIRVNSKLVKVGTMTKGKFDWKTNTCFAELVQMNKMDRKDAEKELGAITQIQDAAKSESRDSFDENETGEFNKSNDFQDILKKEFLQYRSMRLQDLDVIHTIQLLQDILELKEQGRKAKSEEDFISRTQKWNTKNNLLDLLEITKQSGAQFGANWIAGVGGAISLNGGTLANWESLLNAVFNKDTAQKYSLLKDEADSDVYARKHMLNFYDRAADIYGFKKPSGFDKFLDYDNMQPLIKLFQEYDNEKYTYMQQVFSINSPDGTARSSIDLSRSQLITMFAWSLNDQLEQRLMTQFGVEQIRDMFENKLSKEDKDLAWALVDTCESMREDINEVFIRTTGLSLPAVQNYFPSKAERVQSDIDMYHDFFVKSTNPSFIKQRKTCNRIPMKPMSPLEILIPHINKTAKYVILSEKVNWLNQIFKDTAIKTKMQEIWGSKNGEKIYQTMINKLAACTFTNYSKGNNLIAGWLDTMSRNYITSSIGFSGKVALGQLLSVVNYAENMPAMTWAKGFKETLKHPVEAFNYMLENCEYLQTRLAGNSQNEVMAILTSEKDHWRWWRNFMTSNVKWGDIIAITLGGKPYVDYLMNEKGMSKEDAFNQFVEDTLRAQQAGTTSSISEWQSAQAKNCLTRMIFAFRNTDIQYERKFWDTLIQAKKGDIDKKEAIKKLFIYKVLNPFMFTSFLQNMSILALFRGIFAGDDDTITTFLKTAVEAIMIGGVNAYGYAGFLTVGLLESLFALFDRDYKHFETTMPVLTDIDHIVQKFTKGDLEFADWVDGIATSSEFFIGVPTSKLVNFVEGAADTIKGNVGVGLSRMAGWGRYTSTKAWTGEPPEKERKKRKKRKK